MLLQEYGRIKIFASATFLPNISLNLQSYMAKSYFKSYIWLLETLQSRGRLTLNEIKDLWMRSAVNDEGRELATRTFANHVAAIADIFGIDIVCDRGLRDWMMEALSLNNLINESVGLRTRLLFESVPSSHRFLTDIIRAIRDGRMLEVNYQGFTMEASRDFLLEPFCLKEYKRRWYLFARKHGIDKEPHSFALDRMNKVSVSEKTFNVPKSFDAQAFFRTRYGVLQYEGEKPVGITVRASARQAKYFRTLPLHPSQKETEATDTYSIFTYFLAPNYDFVHDILYFGDDVEVLEPKELRDKIAEISSNLSKKYKK